MFEEEAESSQIFYGNLAISRGLQLTRRGHRLSQMWEWRRWPNRRVEIDSERLYEWCRIEYVILRVQLGTFKLFAKYI